MIARAKRERFCNLVTGLENTGSVMRVRADLAQLLQNNGPDVFWQVVQDAAGSVDLPRDPTRLSWRLDWPPFSLNHMYWHLPKGGKRLNAASESWRDQVAALVMNGGRPRVPAGRLALELMLFPPDNRKRDCDNLLKLTQDAVTLGLGIDDYRFSVITARRRLPAPHDPRIIATVRVDDWTPLAR